MKIIFHTNPMPAVRMTQRSKFKNPQAKAYVYFKQGLAHELSLRLMSYPRKIDGGQVTLQLMDTDGTDFPITIPISLKIKFYREDSRACDIDNLIKMVMDLLQTAGIYKNDSQVMEVQALLFRRQKFGNFSLELNTFPEKEPYA